MSEHEPAPIDSNPNLSKRAPHRRSVIKDEVAINDDQRLYAMLAHLLGIVSGPIAALVIWLVKKGDDWVEEEAREALNFQLTVLIAQAVGFLLLIVLVGIFVIIVVSALNIVFCVIAAAHVHGGEAYRYPLTLRLIKGS